MARVALVTGGTRGIGAAISRELKKAGRTVVAGPGVAWRDGDDRVAAGPGWVAVGDQRVLSTDSRHHGRVPTENIRGIVVGRVTPPG